MIRKIYLIGLVVALVLPGLAQGFVAAAPATAQGESLNSTQYLPLVRKPVPPSTPGTTARLSVASDGMEGDLASERPSISADGRFVTFMSIANNLVVGDTNELWDVFVHDRQTGETTRVSVASDGTQGDRASFQPAISADGRFVTFIASSTNLVAGDTNGRDDIFVHDRQTGETTRVSVASDGTQGNLSSGGPAISADGRFVTFDSEASTLVAGDTNDSIDAFVHDRQTGETTRVSVAADGAQGNDYSVDPAISANGRFVTFVSGASNLVVGDTNQASDSFVHDRQTGEITRVSVASDGAQANYYTFDPVISADGRFVTFWSRAENLVPGDTNLYGDVFVHDRQTAQTTRVSVASDGTQGNGESYFPEISADGRFVTFWSSATNLVVGDTNGYADVFVHDRQTGQTTRVSVASDGAQGNFGSLYPAISADGRFVTFQSSATNFVVGDTNYDIDIFVHDRGSGVP